MKTKAQTTRARVTERFLDKHFDLVCHLVDVDAIRGGMTIEEMETRDVDGIADAIDCILWDMCVSKFGKAHGSNVYTRARCFVDFEHVAECVKGNIVDCARALNARI